MKKKVKETNILSEMNIEAGVRDFFTALKKFRAWFYLAFWEVKQRYQRSVLGPWWITISMLIFIVVMGAIYSRLFHQNVSEYLPFFTAGFLFWTFISTTINESCDLFKANSGFLKQIRLPYNMYVLKLLTRNTIILFHNFAVYLFVMGYYRMMPGWKFFLVVPGFVFLIVNIYWVSMVIALVSARFRDMVPIINSCVQIAFFVTPISWMPKLLENSKIINLNPIVYLLDLVRLPLLGIAPSFQTWVVAAGFAGIGWFFCVLIFSAVRTRIPFWID